MAAIAEPEAREMTTWIGWRRVEEPRPRSLTPSLILETQLDMLSSLMVMGFEGSMRPWSIQDWILSRFTGIISSVWLCFTVRVRLLEGG